MDVWHKALTLYTCNKYFAYSDLPKKIIRGTPNTHWFVLNEDTCKDLNIKTITSELNLRIAPKIFNKVTATYQYRDVKITGRNDLKST